MMTDRSRAWLYTGALVGAFVLAVALGGCAMPNGGKVEAKFLNQGVEADIYGRPVEEVVASLEYHQVEMLVQILEGKLLCDTFVRKGVDRSHPRTYDEYCGVDKPSVIVDKGVECATLTVAPSCDGMLSHDAVDALHADYMGDIRGKANRIEELKPFWAAICNLPRDKNGLAPAGSDAWRSWITENDVEGLLERCDE